MKKERSMQDKTVQKLEPLAHELKNGKYILQLYIAGPTPRSSRAVVNIKEICEDRLKDRYDLEVVDVYQQPALAKQEQIIAAPTLVKRLPPPLRRFIGDMSDTECLLAGLGLT
jgi:circadian clock protein KaiB